jgi:glycosyltransferase involved in cell wall biosynthesis
VPNLEGNDRHRVPKYSICITYRNVVETVGKSLDSILSQLDDRFEVIVVDGGSTDGTLETVRKLSRNYRRLTLVCVPCSRGLGRNIAYKLSKGKYLIQGVDGDTIFKPELQSILDTYHLIEREHEKYVLIVDDAFVICSRDTMEEIGGWPDLQHGEDVYVFSKLARVSAQELNRSLTNTVVKEHVKGRRRIARAALRSGFVIWRDLHRVIPFPSSAEMLCLYMSSEKSIPRKLGNIPMFILGAMAQFTRPRYKLHGDELRVYMLRNRMAAEINKITYCNINLVWDTPRSVFPRTVISPINRVSNQGAS